MAAIGLIGFGGIAESALAILESDAGAGLEIAGILVRDATGGTREPRFVTELPELLGRQPSVIAECASHEAVRRYAEDVLRAGVDLIVVSSGALADAELEARLRATAAAAGSRLIIPSGAVGAVDALSAARLGGLERVRYRSRKPAAAWKGTAAEDIVDLERLTAPRVIYQGSAREAARLFPKNSNAAAAVAIAGLGFEETQVELIADPTVTHNVHEIDVEAASGRFFITLSGRPSAANPRTSMLTAYSVARALRAYAIPVVI